VTTTASTSDPACEIASLDLQLDAGVLQGAFGVSAQGRRQPQVVQGGRAKRQDQIVGPIGRLRDLCAQLPELGESLLGLIRPCAFDDFEAEGQPGQILAQPVVQVTRHPAAFLFLSGDHALEQFVSLRGKVAQVLHERRPLRLFSVQALDHVVKCGAQFPNLIRPLGGQAHIELTSAKARESTRDYFKTPYHQAMGDQIDHDHRDQNSSSPPQKVFTQVAFQPGLIWGYPDVGEQDAHQPLLGCMTLLARHPVFQRVHTAENLLPVRQRDDHTARPLFGWEPVTGLAGRVAIVEFRAHIQFFRRKGNPSICVQQIDGSDFLILPDAVEHILNALQIVREHLVLQAIFNDLRGLRSDVGEIGERGFPMARVLNGGK